MGSLHNLASMYLSYFTIFCHILFFLMLLSLIVSRSTLYLMLPVLFSLALCLSNTFMFCTTSSSFIICLVVFSFQGSPLSSVSGSDCDSVSVTTCSLSSSPYTPR